MRFYYNGKYCLEEVFTKNACTSSFPWTLKDVTNILNYGKVKISHEILKDTAKINLKKNSKTIFFIKVNYNKYERRFKKCHLFKVQDEIVQRKE